MVHQFIPKISEIKTRSSKISEKSMKIISESKQDASMYSISEKSSSKSDEDDNENNNELSDNSNLK